MAIPKEHPEFLEIEKLFQELKEKSNDLTLDSSEDGLSKLAFELFSFKGLINDVLLKIDLIQRNIHMKTLDFEKIRQDFIKAHSKYKVKDEYVKFFEDNPGKAKDLIKEHLTRTSPFLRNIAYEYYQLDERKTFKQIGEKYGLTSAGANHRHKMYMRSLRWFLPKEKMSN